MWNLRPRCRKPGPDDLWLSPSVQGIALYRRRFSRAAFIPPACRPRSLRERHQLSQNRREEFGDGGMHRSRVAQHLIRRIGGHQGADDLHDFVSADPE